MNFFKNEDNKDRMGGIGAALSALSQGQSVDLSPYRNSISNRAKSDELAKAMADPALLEKFTPQQRALLAKLPPAAAQQIIVETIMAKPAGPTKGIEVGGSVINPITGEVIYQGEGDPVDPQRTFKGPDGNHYYEDGTPVLPNVTAPQASGFIVSGEGLAEYGIPDDGRAYNISIENGRVSASPVGGGGVTVENNIGGESSQFGKPPTGTAWTFNEDGSHIMEPAPGGGQRPQTVPLKGTDAENKILEQQQEAGKVEAQATMMLQTIDRVFADPGLDVAVGVIGSANRPLGPLAPEAARAMSRIKQIQGQVFLEAYENLKGSGQITEIEGAKAEAALARLETSQNADDFREALLELREVVEAGLSRRSNATDAKPKRLKFDPDSGSLNNGRNRNARRNDS